MKTIIKYSIIVFAYLAVLYPVWLRLSRLSLEFGPTLLTDIFPLFGLAAFALLWLHAISGVFEPWLRANFNFNRFVRVTSTLIFFCIVLHPLLLLISINFNFNTLFLYGPALYIKLGIIGWFLLISYDIGKALKKHNFFIRNWNKILIISTIGFLITFFHSLGLGSDLQSGPLRTVWIFYGVTAIAATIYNYGFKRKRLTYMSR